MSRNEIFSQIQGYDEHLRDMQVCRKYGIDYTMTTGQVRSVVDLYHPSKLNLRVSEIITETQSASTVRLVSAEGYLPPFQAGQYINILVEINGVRTSRPYSIASSPAQTGYYDITVKRVEGGFVSDYLLDRTGTGQALESSSPAGTFYFNPLFHHRDMVLIAGGSGITPFMSMIREVTDRGLDRSIHLIYGNRKEDDIIFDAELRDRASRHDNFMFTPVIAEPSKGCTEHTGFITADLMRTVLDNTDSKTYYLCGPKEMYDFCLPEIDKLGVPSRQVRRELFGGFKNITDEPGWPDNLKGSETFTLKIRGGKSIKARADEPLMVSMERAGIAVPALCRTGACSMCRVKLLSGRVYQPAGVLMRKSDSDFGYIHSCMAFPMEDCEIIL